jgi:hypothetical protein
MGTVMPRGSISRGTNGRDDAKRCLIGWSISSPDLRHRPDVALPARSV